MIGVVVWANDLREKAIIWCEDQATLAYLQGRGNLSDMQCSWPQPGDLVELETETLGELRHARAVSMLSEQSCMQLPRILADASSGPARRNAAPTQREPHLRVVSSRDDCPNAQVLDPRAQTCLRSSAAR